MKRALPMLILFLLAAACGEEDPLAPCERQHACEVEGVDLAILSVTPRWTADQRLDGRVEGRVVEPGDTVRVDVVVVNRGTEATPDSVVLHGWIRDEHRLINATVEVPVLDVGDRRTLRVSFEVPEGPRFRNYRWNTTNPLYDVGGFEIAMRGRTFDEDVDLTNNVAGPVRIHARAPILELRLGSLPDTMLGSQLYPAVLTAENRSPLVAFEDSLPLVFCAHEVGHGPCAMGITDAFGASYVGQVGANATRIFPAMLEFTSGALPYFLGYTLAVILPCTPLEDGGRLCHPHPGIDPAIDLARVLIPNLMAECSPPMLASGDVFDVESAPCFHEIGDDVLAHSVAAFDGVAGECWQAEIVSGEPGLVLVMDQRLDYLTYDSGLDCVWLRRDGPHYLIARPWGWSSTVTPGAVLLRRIDPPGSA